MPTAERYFPTTTSISLAGKVRINSSVPCRRSSAQNAHCDGRNKNKQDIWQIAIELIKVRKIGVKKFWWPKCSKRAKQNEYTNKDVPGWIRKIRNEISFKNCIENIPLHCQLIPLSTSQRQPSIVILKTYPKAPTSE